MKKKARSWHPQTTHMVVMVEPSDFGFNEETASTNIFQKNIRSSTPLSDKAMAEYRDSVTLLERAGIEVISLPSRDDIKTPDAIFPNNWFSVHERDGEHILVVYPLLAANRQAERRPELLIERLAQKRVVIDRTIDLSHYEKKGQILEGTGSIIFDREHRYAYATLSPRTSVEPLEDICEQLGFSPVVFESHRLEGVNIYHTNILMSIGTTYAVVCSEMFLDRSSQETVMAKLTETKKDIIDITQEQMLNMCGNILELTNAKGDPVIVMSDRAKENFSTSQLETLGGYGTIVSIPIPTIETVGGGSARCMIGEIF